MIELSVRKAAIILIALLTLIVAACSPSETDDNKRLTVFAAASMKNALDELTTVYSQTSSVEVTLSYGATPALARQIIENAPANIFISANRAWMDQVEQQGRLLSGSRFDLAAGRLVLINYGDPMVRIDLSNTTADPNDNADTRIGRSRVAMGLVDAVPAGIYGKAALQSLGLWEQIGPNVVQMAHVRAALRLVERGEVPFGIVYQSDAQASAKVSVAATFDEKTHPPIRYAAAAVKGAKESAALSFLTFLKQVDSQEVLARHGFSAVSE